MSSNRLDCFKAYDIRGRIPDQLDEALAERIGRAFAAVVEPAQVVIGHDIRLSSAALTEALTRGLTRSGVDVIQIGLCGTEEIYFATSHLGVQGGIMVTASHNPRDYNGMKLVRAGSRPISGDSGLREIEAAAASGTLPDAARSGRVERRAVRDAYLEHLLGYIDRERLGPLKIVANAGNGCAGPVVRALAAELPLELVELHFEPDGRFPNGIPNPLLPENRPATAEAVLAAGADLGLAWDGDFDRCFFFDEQGAFVEGYYVVGLLATQILARHPGAKIIYDPRLTWNTEELVRQAAGVPVRCKSGHAFIKERMRAEDAVYGGEMSAHHYFREFAYCDSGMIPWLLVAQAMSAAGATLSALVGDRMRAFPASGEINRRVADAGAALDEIRARYAAEATEIDELDGVSMAFGDRWRLNLRRSNTEPLIRLNVESRADEALMRDKTAEILALLARLGAQEA